MRSIFDPYYDRPVGLSFRPSSSSPPTFPDQAGSPAPPTPETQPKNTTNQRTNDNMKTKTTSILVAAATSLTTQASDAQLPDPGMKVDLSNTALVITDPQNDFLSPEGVTWGVVGESVTKNKTVSNIEQLFKAAKTRGMLVAVSPHYYYPHDHQWEHEGALETLMHKIGMFDRKGALTTDKFNKSGADWLERYKPYIEDGTTVVSSPHKVFGPETNDLVLQLRKRGIQRVILGGMSANLCTESHMRELLEQGFEVAVVSDATAAAKVGDIDGYKAALVNFRMIANTVWNTSEAVQAINKASGKSKVEPVVIVPPKDPKHSTTCTGQCAASTKKPAKH